MAAGEVGQELVHDGALLVQGARLARRWGEALRQLRELLLAELLVVVGLGEHLHDAPEEVAALAFLLGEGRGRNGEGQQQENGTQGLHGDLVGGNPIGLSLAAAPRAALRSR